MTFLEQYIVTALWSSNDESTPEGGEPMDANYGLVDIAPESMSRMAADCAAFQEANAGDLGDDPEQGGHDFWLTRNGHGAGFWDGDWPEPAATRLTEASHAAGECHLIVGDDGKVYCE